MSEFSREELGKRILDLRVRKNMSQEEMAEKVGTTRTTVSKWESGNSEPSALQLKKLAEIFGVSIDYLCGNTDSVGDNICVVDTCVLMDRPRVIDVLIKSNIYSKIIVPAVVIQELNYQKDNGKGSARQRAWLAMVSIDKNKQGIIIEPCEFVKDGNNDDKIMSVAKKYAIEGFNDKVDILTNDVYFPLKTDTFGLKNLSVKSMKKVEALLYANDKYDEFNTQNFISEIKSKNLDRVKRAYNSSVNINRLDSQTGQTPLIIAIRNRSYDIIKFLLTLDELDVELRDAHKYVFTPLLHCCQLKDVKAMKMLIENGASVNASSRGVNKGNTPLMVCAWGGFNDGLKLLMESEQLSYNQQDFNGFTALHKACIKNNYEAIELLIKYVDKNIEDFENKKAVEHLKLNERATDYQKIRKLFGE